MSLDYDSSNYQFAIETPVSEPPTRVVSLVPSVTESMFELNVGDRLVGITDDCIHPADRVGMVTRVGGTRDVDVSRIIALRPDLVIANQEENPSEVIEALRRAGLTVWVTFPRTVREAFNLLWTLMHMFDQPEMVERVRAMEWTLDWLERLDESRSLACRVFVPVSLDPLMTVSADTFCHDLLRVCGGVNVVGQSHQIDQTTTVPGAVQPPSPQSGRLPGADARYMRIALDEVIAAQPDVILLPGSPFGFDHSNVAWFEQLDIPAARKNQIRLVDGTLLFWHGTRMGRAFLEVPNLLCPADESE